jgi:hypothetical protein
MLKRLPLAWTFQRVHLGLEDLEGVHASSGRWNLRWRAAGVQRRSGLGLSEEDDLETALFWLAALGPRARLLSPKEAKAEAAFKEELEQRAEELKALAEALQIEPEDVAEAGKALKPGLEQDGDDDEVRLLGRRIPIKLWFRVFFAGGALWTLIAGLLFAGDPALKKLQSLLGQAAVGAVMGAFLLGAANLAATLLPGLRPWAQHPQAQKLRWFGFACASFAAAGIGGFLGQLFLGLFQR